MGVAAAAAPVDPPAKEDIQHAASAAEASPPETAAPADSPEKEETQSAPAGAPGGEADAAGETVVLDAAAEGGEAEEGECGFCLFMKGGGCKEEFVGWEKCVEAADKEGSDVVDRCHEATAALRKCMDRFPDYYEPILRAERAMSEDLEAAKAEAEAGEASEPSSAPLPAAAEEDNKKQAEAVVAKEKEDLAA